MNDRIPLQRSLPAQPHLADGSSSGTKIAIRNLNFYYGESHALKDISLPLYANQASQPSSAHPAAASRRCFAFSTGCTIYIPASAPRVR